MYLVGCVQFIIVTVQFVVVTVQFVVSNRLVRGGQPHVMFEVVAKLGVCLGYGFELEHQVVAGDLALLVIDQCGQVAALCFSCARLNI